MSSAEEQDTQEDSVQEDAEQVKEEQAEFVEVQEERRQEERVKTPVKRTILAKVEDEAYGEMNNHLYVVDLSENGLRINLDRTVEPETELKLGFSLAAFGHSLEGDFEAKCRVIWAKPLAGGTCVLGMQFVELDEEQTKAIQSLIEHWSVKEGFDLVTLADPVATKIRYQEDEPWAPMVGVRALSRDGLQYPSKLEVEPGQELEVRMLLEPGTVQTKVKVRWCKPMANGVFDVGCEFQELSKGGEGYIDLHLRRCR